MTTETTATLTEKIEAVHERLGLARELLAQGNVKPVIGMTDHYVVSSSDGKGTYLVNDVCSCPDYEHRQYLNVRLCKHRLAVLLLLEQTVDKDDESEDLGW